MSNASECRTQVNTNAKCVWNCEMQSLRPAVFLLGLIDCLVHPPGRSLHVHSASVLEQMAVICSLRSKGLTCKRMLSLLSCMSPCSMRISTHSCAWSAHTLIHCCRQASLTVVLQGSQQHTVCAPVCVKNIPHISILTHWLWLAPLKQTSTHQPHKSSRQIDNCSAPKS